jgi:hypothetical protein
MGVAVANGDDFASYYVTKWVDAGIISANKMWRRPDMVVLQPSVETTLTFQAFRNWEEALVRRTFTVVLPAGATGLIWAEGGSGYWATEDGDTIIVDEISDELITLMDTDSADGIPGWGEATWGGGVEGSMFARGSNLGLARSIQLKISGPGGLPWGVNSIAYKYVPRRIR